MNGTTISNVTLPDGTYHGTWGGYVVTLDNGTQLKTTVGIRTPAAPVKVKVQGGAATVELIEEPDPDPEPDKPKPPSPRPDPPVILENLPLRDGQYPGVWSGFEVAFDNGLKLQIPAPFQTKALNVAISVKDVRGIIMPTGPVDTAQIAILTYDRQHWINAGQFEAWLRSESRRPEVSENSGSYVVRRIADKLLAAMANIDENGVAHMTPGKV